MLDEHKEGQMTPNNPSLKIWKPLDAGSTSDVNHVSQETHGTAANSDSISPKM